MPTENARLVPVGNQARVIDLREIQEGKALGRIIGRPIILGDKDADVNLAGPAGPNGSGRFTPLAEIRGRWLGQGVQLKALREGVAIVRAGGTEEKIPSGKKKQLQSGMVIRFRLSERVRKDYVYRVGQDTPKIKKTVTKSSNRAQGKPRR